MRVDLSVSTEESTSEPMCSSTCTWGKDYPSVSTVQSGISYVPSTSNGLFRVWNIEPRTMTFAFSHQLLVRAGFGVIHTDYVEEAFRAVDRRYFVPQVRLLGSKFSC